MVTWLEPRINAISAGVPFQIIARQLICALLSSRKRVRDQIWTLWGLYSRCTSFNCAYCKYKPVISCSTTLAYSTASVVVVVTALTPEGHITGYLWNYCYLYVYSLRVIVICQLLYSIQFMWLSCSTFTWLCLIISP